MESRPGINDLEVVEGGVNATIQFNLTVPSQGQLFVFIQQLGIGDREEPTTLDCGITIFCILATHAQSIVKRPPGLNFNSTGGRNRHVRSREQDESAVSGNGAADGRVAGRQSAFAIR